MSIYNEKPIEIGRLQRYAMEQFYVVSNGRRDVGGGGIRAIPVSHSQKIACIGGGPASLACAAELRCRGFFVSVYDNRPLPGGLATYGVAEYKLRPSDVLREVDLIRARGVEFRCAEVGLDVTLDEIERTFEVIFLGLGLGAMHRMGIPGEDVPGVIDALHFIERYKIEKDFLVDRCVAVIGGGNTAIDAANAARRLGAEEVHIFYRRTEEQMPAFKREYEHAKTEGAIFHWLTQPVGIIESRGRLAGVKFVRTRLGSPDDSGRSSVEPVHGSDFNFMCDTAISAVGQTRFVELLKASRGIELAGGSIKVDRSTGRTSNARYYAGGDCVNGGREVVDAVADGKRAALAIAVRLEEESKGAYDG
jgi:glutamate synthase (NADPH/NADH) small chain